MSVRRASSAPVRGNCGYNLRTTVPGVDAGVHTKKNAREGAQS